MSKSPEKSSEVTPSQKKYIGRKEMICYGVAAGGQGMIYAIMSSYISEFYLNVAMLPATFVLLLMLFARLWDAINDPLMGALVDRVRPKLGKFKSYVLFTPIPVAVLTFFMFYKPESFNQTQLMIYAAVTYTLWGMIYTVSDVPFWSLPNAMTPNERERANTISFGRTVNGVGSAIPIALYMVLGLVLPYLTAREGVEFDKLQYMIIALVCAIFGSALFVISYFTTKERVVLPPKPARRKGEESAFKRLFSCRPLVLVIIMGVLSSGRYLVSAGAIHVARYAVYIGPSLEGLTGEALTGAVSSSRSLVSTIFTVCSAIGMFGPMLIMPLLYKKFNYKQLIIGSSVLGLLGGVTMFALFVSGVTFYACIPFLIIASIPAGVINVTSYAMVGDSLDYMEWKTGHRETALCSACQSFVNKLGNALATCGIVLVYIGLSIDPAGIVKATGSINPSAVDATTKNWMFALVSIVPAISCVLCTIPIFFYDLVGKKKEQINNELRLRREERGVVVSE